MSRPNTIERYQTLANTLIEKKKEQETELQNKITELDFLMAEAVKKTNDVNSSVDQVVNSKIEIEALKERKNIFESMLKDVSVSSQEESEQMISDVKRYIDNLEQEIIKEIKPISKELEQKYDFLLEKIGIANKLLSTWKTDVYPYKKKVGNNIYIDRDEDIQCKTPVMHLLKGFVKSKIASELFGTEQEKRNYKNWLG